MSWLQAVQAPETLAKDDALRSAPGTSIDQLGPGSWEGLAPAIGRSAMRGLARVGEAAGVAGAVPFVIADALSGGTEAQDAYFGDVQATMRRAVDFWAPDAATTGHASQVVGSIVEGLAPLAAGPQALIGAGLSRGVDVVEQGGSAAGAVGVATVQAAAAGLGLKVPAAIGKSLATRVASGAAGNVAFGAAATGAEAGILAVAGDDTQAAERIKALQEPETYLIQAIMGGAFGLHAHVTAPRAPSARPPSTPALLDAALVTNNAHSFNDRTAPGAPADPQSAALHQAALEETLAQLNRGDPAVVTAPVGDAEFKPGRAPREEVGVAAIDQAVAQALADGMLEPPKKGAVDELSQYRRLLQRSIEDGQMTPLEAYDLETDFLRARSASEEVKLDAEVLREVPPPDGASSFGEVGDEVAAASAGRYPAAPIVLQRGNQHFGEAHISERRAQEFRDAGYASPADALLDITRNYTEVYSQPQGRLLLVKQNGQKKYAIAQLRRDGDAYTVTTWFMDDRGPRSVAYENAGGRRLLVRVASRHAIQPFRPPLTTAIGETGQDSSSVALGASSDANSTTQAVPAKVAAGPAPAAEQADPIPSALRAAVEGAPDQLVAGGLNDDGSPAYRSASEALAHIEAELNAAKAEGAKYEAAVSCFLRRGP